MRKTVKSINGVFAFRDECILINKQYYIKNTDCFLLENGKWYRKESPLILYDYELKTYRLKSNMKECIHGIVNLKNKNDLNNLHSYEFGLFTQNNKTNT